MDDWSASVLVPAVALCGTSNYYARPVTGLVDKARPFMDDIGPSFIETRRERGVGACLDNCNWFPPSPSSPWHGA